MMRDSWMKVGWGLFRKEQLLETRRKLKAENDVVMTLLGVSNS